MNPLRTLFLPRKRRGQRVAVVGGRASITLNEPNRLAISHINGWK